MDKDTVIKAAKELIAAGTLTVKEIAGEMAPAEAPAPAPAPAPDAALVGEMAAVKEALGISGEMSVVEVAKLAAKAMNDLTEEKHKKTLEKVIGEKVSGEMAQALVRDMLAVPVGSTEEVISGEIAKILEKDSVKTILAGQVSGSQVPAAPVVGQENTGSLRVKRERI